jgi:acetolactate synthase regulatory subunit
VLRSSYGSCRGGGAVGGFSLLQTTTRVALTVAVLAILSMGGVQACPKGETSAHRSIPDVMLSQDASRSPSALAAQLDKLTRSLTIASITTLSKTANKLRDQGCCGDGGHHPPASPCATGSCSACCAVTVAVNTPLILAVRRLDHRLATPREFRSGMTFFVFRPPRVLS